MKNIAEIRKLPLPERLQLIGEIWDSIVENPTLLPVSEELARELEIRLAVHRADPSSAQAWDIVDHEVFGSD
ncbi:MAG TPA: addiction module protein [Thermoanaerobaculia bacterium]|nr:addiction module protein [Thermoanaerobaculia bacterium]